MSGLQNLEEAFGLRGAGRDPKGMCGSPDPFDLTSGLGRSRGYHGGIRHGGGGRSRTGEGSGFRLGGFLKDVLTGAVVGGLSSAGFYGVGKALRESVVGRKSSNTPIRGRRPDFYVTPDGMVVPSTGYRYMSSSGASDALNTGRQYATYFGFDKFDSAKRAREAFQISYEWSDCKVRGTFDTLQVIGDMYTPKTLGNTTMVPEPFAISYPEYGEGGAQQFRVDKVIEFLEVEIIED